MSPAAVRSAVPLVRRSAVRAATLPATAAVVGERCSLPCAPDAGRIRRCPSSRAMIGRSTAPIAIPLSAQVVGSSADRVVAAGEAGRRQEVVCSETRARGYLLSNVVLPVLEQTENIQCDIRLDQ